MKKLVSLLVAVGLCVSLSAKAETGIGISVGKPFWGLDVAHNGFRMNVSLDDQFGIGANKTFAVSGTPMYFFIGGQYVDRNQHYIALTPGIGAEFRVKPVGFYIDLTPAIYLDELDVELEARAGIKVYF
ncbi:hypothetical protein BCS96_10945 [Vibrio breoganii]|uniref:hypothetical protein n=1 Tax=Vibrio breoganii TaxID=553239 RepID=UPI000C833BE9|nr:hypothetical protein [Vibrio breoganii]PMG01601.1 hypothetical protein BCV02_13770 [Vibrio breoganii]PMG83594.1 hypothetical protein BCU81_01920 [Vibrio breoganii]PMG93018.1 hypothetical protein BCU80_00725 [Vibrio breoganii]PMK27762.1 hypothetical protein BCU03_15815 [Vibrio breoganii]PML14935.1 hypothetical protein BCT84_09685 [Vibrio breoganii]